MYYWTIISGSILKEWVGRGRKSIWNRNIYIFLKVGTLWKILIFEIDINNKLDGFIHTETPKGHSNFNYVERISNCTIMSKK